MILTLQIVLVIAAILMTVFVLLHKGKGGGLSSLFGGGVQSNLSGSTVVERTSTVTPWSWSSFGLPASSALTSFKLTLKAFSWKP